MGTSGDLEHAFSKESLVFGRSAGHGRSANIYTVPPGGEFDVANTLGCSFVPVGVGVVGVAVVVVVVAAAAVVAAVAVVVVVDVIVVVVVVVVVLLLLCCCCCLCCCCLCCCCCCFCCSVVVVVVVVLLFLLFLICIFFGSEGEGEREQGEGKGERERAPIAKTNCYRLGFWSSRRLRAFPPSESSGFRWRFRLSRSLTSLSAVR